MASDKDKTGGDSATPWVVWEGVLFPRAFEWQRPIGEQIEAVRNLEMRPDDVLLCAIPKAGTHWLWEVGSMLLAGRASYEKNVKEHVMLECADMDVVRDTPSPRILNTHLVPDMLPKQALTKKVKILHVYRNAKDVCVSGFFHTIQRAPMTFNEYFDNIFGNKDLNPRGNYFSYLRLMDEFSKANKDHPILHLSFEEMKEDPLGVVTRLAEFLGVACSPELCREVVEATTLDKMREADESKVQAAVQEKNKGKKMTMYRKGQVGDWKNHLTVAQSERLDEAMKQLEGTSFNFRYTL